MKLVIIIFVAIIAGVLSARRYSANEEKQNDKKRFIFMPDDNGQLHFVDLQQPKVDPNVTLDDFNVYFYNPNEPTIGIHLTPHNFNGEIPSDTFDPTIKSIFVSHGWTGFNISGTCDRVRHEVIQHGGANIFVIDWNRISHEFYTVAVMGINDLGIICGQFIDKMLDKYNIDSEQIMLIGESLGAHVVGACGASMKKKPGTILGLDPAQPLFFVDEPENRLGSEDGEVVHIMHTNNGFLGFISSIGHVDYFANGGGINQPGCGVDIFGICAHGRAPAYYKESINYGGFKSHKCDSYEEYLSGSCEQNQISYFGGINLDSQAAGDYYLDTNGESPFALN